MKRIFSLLISAFLLTFLAACGADASKPQTSFASPTEAQTKKETEAQPKNTAESEADKSEKALVVFFSWSGNTKSVAEAVQRQTNADIFEIVPKTPYSTDYDTVVKDAKQQQQDNARPEIKDTVKSIDDYDTIYVGFPNWWGDMPMILYTFFDTYDLSGKTVALFCTSGGSGLSNTVNEVRELEKNATVTEGLHIRSSAASQPDDAVSKWLDEIKTVK